MKKYSKFLIQIALVLLFVVSLSIHSINSAWNYYEGAAKSTSIDFGIKLKNFFPDGKNEDGYIHDFPEDDPDAQENKDIFEQIMGDKKDEYDKDKGDIGLFNPDSDIAKVIGPLEQGGLITSIDVNSNPDLTGPHYAELVKLASGQHFAIKKETKDDGAGVSTVFIYTTNTPLFTNGNDHTSGQDIIYEDGFIHGVYRASLVWKEGYGVLDDGYHIINSEFGYCKQGILPNNNPNHNFFLPDTWTHGENNGIDVQLVSSNPTYKVDSFIKLKACDKNGKKINGVTWSVNQKDEKFISVDNKGEVTISGTNIMEYDFKSLEVKAEKNGISGTYRFKINIGPDKSNRGLIKDSKGNPIGDQTAVSVAIGDSGRLYTNGITSQGIKFNTVNQSKCKIKFTTFDSNMVFKVEYIYQYGADNILKEIKPKLVKTENNSKTWSIDFAQAAIDNPEYVYVTVNACNPVEYSITN